MHLPDTTDEQLLSARDAASFELFYCRHVESMLGFFARRTGDPELAADLCAETFAAALAGRRRYRTEAGAAAAWLYGNVSTSSPSAAPGLRRAARTARLGRSGSSSPTWISRASNGSGTRTRRAC